MTKRGHDERIVILDLETSGLNPEVDRVLEVGAIVVERDLSVRIVDGVPHAFQYVVRQHAPLIQFATREAYDMHVASGLAEDLKGPTWCDFPVRWLGEVEDDLIGWLQATHGFLPGTAVIAGNSIHQDRAFIRRWMPDLDKFLHYRMIDCSAMREAYRRWVDPDFPENWKRRWGEARHRTIPDCENSLNELRFFRSATIPAAMP